MVYGSNSNSSSSSGSYASRPSRLSRIDLGANDDVDLDYSEQAGPSNRSRHIPSERAFHSSSSTRQTHEAGLYYDRDTTLRSSRTRYEPACRPPIRPRSRSASPQPDADVLAYIRAQKEQDTSKSNHELELVEHLKREKFQHGAGKLKSRAHKEREAEQRKKKQAQEDAAKAYNDFVAAMRADDERDAEEIDGSSAAQNVGRKKSMGFVAAGGKAYVGSRTDSAQSKPITVPEQETRQTESRPTVPLKRVSTAFSDDSSDDKVGTNTTAHAHKEPPQRKRHQAMSTFLTQLQTEQAERESRLSDLASSTNVSISTLLAHETLSKPGSRQLTSDPLSTNICILSLPPNVDERSMGEFFAAWGDVATVKIMWPRGEQRERLAGLTGFVAFMTRGEAEYAFKQADGAMWGGVRIKLSWGKAMPLPNRAMYPMFSEHRADRQTEDHRSGANSSRTNSAIPHLIIRHRTAGASTEDQRQKIRDQVHNQYPEMQRQLIETVASRIRSNGAHFEHILREREAENAQFAFLFEPDSVLHHYFRICLDAHYVVPAREEPFGDQGSDELYSTDSGEESETRRCASARSTTLSVPLAPLAQRRFHSMLRSLTLRRERIARITAFALDHATSYTSIVSILISSLLQARTPIPRKLARLYAISDILHNAGSPISNAWRYRAALESQLPLVFAHLGQVATCFEGRMRREEFKAKVVALLDIWDGWIVLSPHVLARLRSVFHRPPVVGAAKVPEDKIQQEHVDGEALNSNASHAAAECMSSTVMDGEEDVDGEAL